MANAAMSLTLRAVRRPIPGSFADSLPPLRLAIPIVVAAWAVVFEAWRYLSIVRTQPGNEDYRVFYLAAKVGLTWGWGHMYDPSRLQALNSGFGAVGSSEISPLYTYVNPPLLAWLIAPLTPLPFSLGLLVWTAMNVCALVVASRLVFGHNRTVWALAVLGSLAVWPTAFAIERGQPELLLYALVVGAWWCARRGHERWAGVILGLAGCLKPSDILFLPLVFLICGYRRTALWWLATSAAALAVFAAALGPIGLGTYLGVSAWSASDPNFTSTPFLSPFGPRLSLLVGQGIFAALAVAGVWLNRRSLRLAIAIGIVGTLSSAVHLHEYDYVGLVFAAWFVIDGPISIAAMAWLATGIICLQLPAIGIRTAILVWQPIWLAFLALHTKWRRRSAQPQESPPLTEPVAA